jgi:hypothetical protein
MGEIHIPIGTFDDHHWTPYMTQMLDAIVADWTERVELGAITKWANGSYEPISTEHLRIAKAYLNRTSPAQVDTLAITDVRREWSVDELPPVKSPMPPDVDYMAPEVHAELRDEEIRRQFELDQKDPDLRRNPPVDGDLRAYGVMPDDVQDIVTRHLSEMSDPDND